MSEELKPVCCGCGGEAEVCKSPLKDGYCYFVRCDRCETATNIFVKVEEAIEAWNRAMGAKDINVPNKERTAKVIEHDASVTDTDGYKYLRTEYICGVCKKKVIGGDDYCSHCGARLEWK